MDVCHKSILNKSKNLSNPQFYIAISVINYTSEEFL